MKEKVINSLIIAAFLILVVSSVALVLEVHGLSGQVAGSGQSQTLGGSNAGPISSGGATRFTQAPLNTIIACGAGVSTLVVATSTARNYVTLVNDSANNIYLAEGVAAVGSNGIRLNANGGSYEINALNLWTGAVYCIASSTSVLNVLASQ